MLKVVDKRFFPFSLLLRSGFVPGIYSCVSGPKRAGGVSVRVISLPIEVHRSSQGGGSQRRKLRAHLLTRYLHIYKKSHCTLPNVDLGVLFFLFSVRFHPLFARITRPFLRACAFDFFQRQGLYCYSNSFFCPSHAELPRTPHNRGTFFSSLLLFFFVLFYYAKRVGNLRFSSFCNDEPPPSASMDKWPSSKRIISYVQPSDLSSNLRSANVFFPQRDAPLLHSLRRFSHLVWAASFC